MASYFSYFPNVYVGEGVTDEEAFKYKLCTNLFRRAKARPDLEKYSTLFETYAIVDNETPSQLADKIWDDDHLDWVILLVNNITDVYTQWPKSEDDLMEYVQKNYTDPDAIHHYETQKVEYNNITFIESGIEVNRTYRTTLPDGTTKSEEDSIYPVTNYEHENFLNEKKRLIMLPISQMLDIVVDEFKELVEYSDHEELDDLGNKKTPLSIASRFLENTGATTGSEEASSDLGTITSYDNGPGSKTINV
tara:strand:+ start:1212 stop:1958 length:747 start_codon:yes stop_codon:yes gene_type:complete